MFLAGLGRGFSFEGEGLGEIEAGGDGDLGEEGVVGGGQDAVLRYATKDGGHEGAVL